MSFGTSFNDSRAENIGGVDAAMGTLVRALAERKGIDPDSLGAVSGEAHKQQQYDLLADTIRNHMDMQKIYNILEEGV